jgi:hypothetical protein
MNFTLGWFEVYDGATLKHIDVLDWGYLRHFLGRRLLTLEMLTLLVTKGKITLYNIKSPEKRLIITYVNKGL